LLQVQVEFPFFVFECLLFFQKTGLSLLSEGELASQTLDSFVLKMSRLPLRLEFVLNLLAGTRGLLLGDLTAFADELFCDSVLYRLGDFLLLLWRAASNSAARRSLASCCVAMTFFSVAKLFACSASCCSYCALVAATRGAASDSVS